MHRSAKRLACVPIQNQSFHILQVMCLEPRADNALTIDLHPEILQSGQFHLVSYCSPLSVIHCRTLHMATEVRQSFGFRGRRKWRCGLEIGHRMSNAASGYG